MNKLLLVSLFLAYFAGSAYGAKCFGVADQCATMSCESDEICVKYGCSGCATTRATLNMECTFDSECPGSNWFCLHGQCVEEHTGERCWVDTDCSIGDHCIDGVCQH
jgi:hypothetical protein